MFGETARRRAVEVAMGEETADTVITGGTHVNVHSGELLEEDIAIVGDRVAVVGDVDDTIGDDTTVIDAEGQFVAPGLIEGHLHSYHSLFNGTDVAKLLLEHGTTAYVDGFYGQVNAAGMRGLEVAKSEVEQTPVNLVFLVPSLGHSQMSRAGIPRNENAISTEEVYELLERDDCYGLEEPTYEPIVDFDEEIMDMFDRTIELDKVVSGHAAGPSDRELLSYIAAGASTDHEPTTKEGAELRARRGMRVLQRHAAGLENLPETIRAVTETDVESRMFGMSGDVRIPSDLFESGAIDENIRAAIENGTDPVSAIQMATINTAEAFRVDQELGSLTPGKVADVVIVDDLVDFSIDTVLAHGEVVTEGGELVADIDYPDYPDWVRDTIDIGGGVEPEKFAVAADGDEATVRTIEVPEAGLVTEAGEVTLPVEDGAVSLGDTDVVKIASVDRHDGSAKTGLGFMRGFGLEAGALGFSYNAVLQNLIIAGVDDEDMATVANRIDELGGGLVAVKDGEVVAEVPLSLFGIQSAEPVETTLENLGEFDTAVDEELGCGYPLPLFSMEFHLCPYPETPGLRLTPHGYVHIGERRDLDLFV